MEGLGGTRASVEYDGYAALRLATTVLKSSQRDSRIFRCGWLYLKASIPSLWKALE